MADPRERTDLPAVRRLTVPEWLRGRLTDFRRAEAARRVLCEHDEAAPPCAICSVRYW
ncbi:hypothetical protein VSH64_21010 [Amycolatopsis rhabdoformis]|uniref:Uncharacterized protein n=1 Tax=Amycolatopsis rhabdoformis TaxID=1448059 RepID=A0ABZ1IL75_9PSEU|nr:hypothetical protein [Amycolatopsis rhabdoformis]WSE34533.1 hypothetical protein VSH64_21010 [Amycolatopsis rhabdoformis]